MRMGWWGVGVALMTMMAAGCAREQFAIGRGAPTQEIEQCLKLSEKKHFEEAIQCLEIFKSRFPGTPEAEDAELRIGDNYYTHKEYLLAAESYDAFLKLHPAHPKSDYAHYRLGLAYLLSSPKAIDRDQGHLDDALKAFETVLVAFPHSPYLDAARQQRAVVRGRIGRRHFYIGNFYYRTGEYQAAIPRFMEVLQNYPEATRLEEAAYKVVVANVRLGRIAEARTVTDNMAQAFPASPWTKRAEHRLRGRTHGNG